MRKYINYLLVAGCSILIVNYAMGITLPQNIEDYLENQNLTEEGAFSGDETATTAFIDYVKANWSPILDDIETAAPNIKKQSMVIAAAEALAGRDYLQFFNKLCDRKDAGKVEQASFEQAITGITPSKTGFLAYNYQDSEVQQLVQRLQNMLDQNNPLQQMLTDILSGDAAEAAEYATLGQGLPAPETLPPL